MNRNYEGIIFIKPGLTEEELAAATEKIKAGIEAGKGEITDEKAPEKKTAPYEVKGSKDVFYYYIKFTMDPSQIALLTEKLRLSEQVARYMVAKVEEPKEEPKKEEIKEASSGTEAANAESSPETEEKQTGS